MTTLHDFDFRHVLEIVRDKASLELVHRVVLSEVSFHESRLTQLKQIEQAVSKHLQTMK